MTSQQLTYRKLVSLNPTRREMINANKAIAGYTRYLKDVARSGLYDGKGNLITAKTFNEWLKTEI